MPGTDRRIEHEPLVSQLLAAESDLRDLVEDFVGELPGRIEELRAAHRRLDWEQLRMLAHRLKGAAGSYGYPSLSALAAEMEAHFDARRDEALERQLRDLEALARAARAGLD